MSACGKATSRVSAALSGLAFERSAEQLPHAFVGLHVVAVDSELFAVDAAAFPNPFGVLGLEALTVVGERAGVEPFLFFGEGVTCDEEPEWTAGLQAKKLELVFYSVTNDPTKGVVVNEHYHLDRRGGDAEVIVTEVFAGHERGSAVQDKKAYPELVGLALATHLWSAKLSAHLTSTAPPLEHLCRDCAYNPKCASSGKLGGSS